MLFKKERIMGRHNDISWSLILLVLVCRSFSGCVAVEAIKGGRTFGVDSNDIDGLYQKKYAKEAARVGLTAGGCYEGWNNCGNTGYGSHPGDGSGYPPGRNGGGYGVGIGGNEGGYGNGGVGAGGGRGDGGSGMGQGGGFGSGGGNSGGSSSGWGGGGGRGWSGGNRPGPGWGSGSKPGYGGEGSGAKDDIGGNGQYGGNGLHDR